MYLLVEKTQGQKQEALLTDCQTASPFYSRNGTEARSLATQPQRYFCLFVCGTRLVHVIRPSFSEAAQPALLIPSLWKDRCGAAAGGKKGSGTHP